MQKPAGGLTTRRLFFDSKDVRCAVRPVDDRLNVHRDLSAYRLFELHIIGGTDGELAVAC
jgi:hypothetical protein